MTSPSKPWEKARDMSSINNPVCDPSLNKCDYAGNGEPALFSSEKISNPAPKIGSIPVTVEPSVSRVPSHHRPEIPPRNYNGLSAISPQNAAYSSYNRLPYNYQRMPYGGGGYSMYGYGSNPYYGGGYGGYGMNSYNNIINNPESRFIRAAEESTRPTFLAIESLTRAINSIAFMMESTFGSLNMSFQAVLSVIENFSQARTFLKQFFTSILTLRIFHKFFSILVGILRRMNLISEQTVANLLWRNVESQQIASSSSGVSMWPVFTFLGLMFGAPYFISKMLPVEDKSKSENEWNPSVDRYIPLVAVHDFQAGSDQEIGFQKGQILKMMPTELHKSPSPYWVFAANEHNQTGYIPRNHVTPT